MTGRRRFCAAVAEAVVAAPQTLAQDDEGYHLQGHAPQQVAHRVPALQPVQLPRAEAPLRPLRLPEREDPQHHVRLSPLRRPRPDAAAQLDGGRQTRWAQAVRVVSSVVWLPQAVQGWGCRCLCTGARPELERRLPRCPPAARRGWAPSSAAACSRAGARAALSRRWFLTWFSFCFAQQPPPGLQQGTPAEDHRHRPLPVPQDHAGPLQERLQVRH